MPSMLRAWVTVVVEEDSVGIGTEGELRLVAHDRIERAIAEARESVTSEETSDADATAILRRYAITPSSSTRRR
jgi:hypothetical protein